MKTIKLPITLLMAAGMLSLAPLGAQAAGSPATDTTTTLPAAKTSVSGKIVKLTADSIAIKSHKGMTQTFAINSATKYGTAEKAERYQDLQDGKHVRINYAEMDGTQVATLIQELPGHHHGKS
ncbi:MAG: hypothetical protein ACMG5Z_05240 [Luteimonas sp.]